jgi:FixJ family two-component response regulator
MIGSASIVFVVDDDPSVGRAIKRLLSSVGLETSLFGSPREFLSFLRPSVPSCLILDVRLPNMSGLDLQEELTVTADHIPIIFITAYGDVPMAVRALKAGAVHFLPKPFRDQDLLESVQLALAHDTSRRLLDAELTTLRERLSSLTPRERSVLNLSVSGLPNKQIAQTIKTSEATVKMHRSQLTRKMGATSFAHLVRMSVKLGIPMLSFYW